MFSGDLTTYHVNTAWRVMCHDAYGLSHHGAPICTLITHTDTELHAVNHTLITVHC